MKCIYLFFITSCLLLLSVTTINAQIPSIISFTPNSTCPGTSIPVFITGTNFIGATKVTVGGTAVDSFTVNESSSITAYISKGNTGKIVVTNTNGTATSDSVFTFGKGYTAYAYVANSIDNSLSVLSVGYNKTTITIPVGSGTSDISASPDGRSVYVTNSLIDSIKVISTATNKIIANIQIPSEPTRSCFSPDGTRFYQVNYSHWPIPRSTLTVINAIKNTVLQTIQLNKGAFGIAISPDGNMLYLTNSDSGYLNYINTATNTVVAKITTDKSGEYITVSHDGLSLYLINFKDSSISVINTVSQKVTATITLGSIPISAVVSPDDSKLYVVNIVANTISVINTITNKIIATIPVGKNPQGVSISPDGKELYVPNCLDNTVSIINANNYRVISKIYVGNKPTALGNFIANVPTTCNIPFPPYIISFTPNATCLGNSTPIFITGTNLIGATSITVGGNVVDSFIVNDSSSITAFVSYGTTGKIELTTPYGTAKSDSTFTFGKGYSAYAYVANTDNTVSVIKLATNKVVSTVKVGSFPKAVSASPDGTRVYVANANDSTLSVINTISNKVIQTINLDFSPNFIVVSPNNKKIYVSNLIDGTICIISSNIGKVISKIKVGARTNGLCASTNDSILYVTNNEGVMIINTNTNVVVSTIPIIGGTSAISVSKDGTRLYVSNVGNTVSVISTLSKTVISTITISLNSFPQALSISPDGTRVYVTNNGGFISVINTEINSVIDEIPDGNNSEGLSFSPDGTVVYIVERMASGGIVSVYDTTTDTLITLVDVGDDPFSFGNFIANVPTSCDNPLQPTITSFSPKAACPNTIVTIKGIGFTGVTTVSFGNMTASSFALLNDSVIVVIVGNGASGNVQVTTTNGISSIGGFTYLSPSTSTSNESICIGSSYTFNGTSYSTAGTYTTHLTNSLGCDSVATLILKVKTATTSTTNASICTGSFYTFNGTNYTTAGTYIAHLTNNAGCDSTATLNLILEKGITIAPIQGESMVCINSTINLKNITEGGTWKSLFPEIASINDNGIVIANKAGIDSIQYGFSSSCGNQSVFFPLTVFGVKPIIETIIKNDSCLHTESGSIFLTVKGPESPYQFDFNGTMYGVPFTITNLGAGSYPIKIVDSIGCIVDNLPNIVITQVIDGSCDTLYVPTGFLPSSLNINGYNRVLKPYGGGASIQSLAFRVYNRYGNLLFETHDINKGWDGTINGKIQETGTYVWYLEYMIANSKRIKTAKGVSVLIR